MGTRLGSGCKRASRDRDFSGTAETTLDRAREDDRSLERGADLDADLKPERDLSSDRSIVGLVRVDLDGGLELELRGVSLGVTNIDNPLGGGW